MLCDDTAELLAEWQMIYPDTDVSSAWVSKQFDVADTAIADIAEAKQAQTQADSALQMVSQQLETSGSDITRETNALNETEAQLGDMNNTITDLQADIASTEERFWESMPDTFHGVKPKKAVDQFEDKIETVASHETELSQAEADLRVLNANIRGRRKQVSGSERKS